jgi:hypothetical protein
MKVDAGIRGGLRKRHNGWQIFVDFPSGYTGMPFALPHRMNMRLKACTQLTQSASKTIARISPHAGTTTTNIEQWVNTGDA